MQRRADSSPVTLVTGANGFVGSWFLRHARELGWPVIGAHKPGTEPIAGAERWVAVDLRDRAACHALLKDAAPDYVLHLAAMAVPREAQADRLEALRMNYLAVDHLLDAMAEQAPSARLLHVSSGEVYGSRAIGSEPLNEDEPPAPQSIYASTKAAAEQRAAWAVEACGLDVVRARPINHSGPGRPPSYAESSFARQLACIEHGLQEPLLRVGRLDDVRDFSDVRDVVRAYVLLLERGERGGVYNVCSGRGWRIDEILDHLISLSSAEPRIETDPERVRSGAKEARALVGDPGRLRELGWKPLIRFERTLQDVLDDWRAQVSQA